MEPRGGARSGTFQHTGSQAGSLFHKGRGAVQNESVHLSIHRIGLQLYYTSPASILYVIKYKIHLQKKKRESAMVFLPMPAYCLSKLRLSPDSGDTLIILALVSYYKSENGVRSRAVPNRKDSTREMTRGTHPRRPFRAHTVRALLVQTVTLKHKPLFTGAVLYFLEIARGRRDLATGTSRATLTPRECPGQRGPQEFGVFTYICEQ